MKQLVLALFICIVFFACKKKEDPEPQQQVAAATFQFVHMADSLPLGFNIFQYTNTEGNLYKVTRLEYYVSKIIFEKADGTVYDANMYHYINGEDVSTHTLTISNIPEGTYKQVRFIFGIDSARNVPSGLDNNTINNDMEWPSFMGGGYHFMRFEGLFKDTAGQDRGYAIHLGKTPNQVLITLPNSGITVAKGDKWNYTVSMNINNWFKEPNPIDLNDDYTSIMEDDNAQQKFAQNAVHVFSLESRSLAN